MISSEKTFKDICSFAEALASKAPLMHQPSERYTYSMGMDVLGVHNRESFWSKI